MDGVELDNFALGQGCGSLMVWPLIWHFPSCQMSVHTESFGLVYAEVSPGCPLFATSQNVTTSHPEQRFLRARAQRQRGQGGNPPKKEGGGGQGLMTIQHNSYRHNLFWHSHFWHSSWESERLIPCLKTGLKCFLHGFKHFCLSLMQQWCISPTLPTKEGEKVLSVIDVSTLPSAASADVPPRTKAARPWSPSQMVLSVVPLISIVI